MISAQTLQQIEKAIFAQFKENPEHFIAEASRIIREQKSTIIIEKLEYSALDERYDIDLPLKPFCKTAYFRLDHSTSTLISKV